MGRGMASSEPSRVTLVVSALVGSMKVARASGEIEFFIDKPGLGAIING